MGAGGIDTNRFLLRFQSVLWAAFLLPLCSYCRIGKFTTILHGMAVKAFDTPSIAPSFDSKSFVLA